MLDILIGVKKRRRKINKIISFLGFRFDFNYKGKNVIINIFSCLNFLWGFSDDIICLRI